MSIKSWAQLLTHLLYLYIFIELASGIVMIVSSRNCINIYKERVILPLGLEIGGHSLDVSVHFMFTLVNSYGFIIILTSLFGLVGVCCLERWDTLNLTFGLVLLQYAFTEFTTAHSFTSLLNSYDDIIQVSMVEQFKSVNTFNLSKHITEDKDSYNLASKMIRKHSRNELYNLPFNTRGWSTASEGGFRNQTFVDFLQMSVLKCCGLTGRSYWDMRIPTSCCPDKYRGESCVISVAHTKSCQYDYHAFRNCGATVRTELVCFGIVTFLAAIDSLYLAYLRIQFPDGDYKSDKSSDDGEELNSI